MNALFLKQSCPVPGVSPVFLFRTAISPNLSFRETVQKTTKKTTKKCG
jgi:hypothetical protein